MFPFYTFESETGPYPEHDAVHHFVVKRLIYLTADQRLLEVMYDGLNPFPIAVMSQKQHYRVTGTDDVVKESIVDMAMNLFNQKL